MSAPEPAASARVPKTLIDGEGDTWTIDEDGLYDTLPTGGAGVGWSLAYIREKYGIEEVTEYVSEAAGTVWDREAVIDLMDGKPTTLRAGLTRYLVEVAARDELQPRARILTELGMLLAYPWPDADG